MKDYLYKIQLALYGSREIIGFGEDSFFVKEIDRDCANKIIIDNHYSGKFYNASYIHLGVFIDNVLKGVLQFGYAMNPASQQGVVLETGIDEYLELNRMWLCDSAKRNSESRAISYAIKYIRGRWPKIKWIQSFADERCGKYGVVYQAANFDYFGEHVSVFWHLDNEVFHNSLMTRNPKLSKSAAFLQHHKEHATSMKLRQFRYIFFISQRHKKLCLLKPQAFPKHA